jgi:IclR helix-turn-helix domain
MPKGCCGTRRNWPGGRMIADTGSGTGDGNDARRVIASAFDLLELVGVLAPVRLAQLTDATGVPHATVHRLLQQLIGVGAVRRDGVHYFLGAGLLRLGAAVTPVRRLRAAARRPIAELAAATGAAVSLSGTLGDDVVFLDSVQARMELAFTPQPGAPVLPGTAQARAHTEFARTTPIVDAGHTVPDLSCAAMAIPLGRGGLAALSTLIGGRHPPLGLLAATRATAARIGAILRES